HGRRLRVAKEIHAQLDEVRGRRGGERVELAVAARADDPRLAGRERDGADREPRRHPSGVTLATGDRQAKRYGALAPVTRAPAPTTTLRPTIRPVKRAARPSRTSASGAYTEPVIVTPGPATMPSRSTET